MAKAPAPVKPDTKNVSLKVAYGEPAFKWQMVFNTFDVETIESGRIVRFAFTTNGYAAEVVRVFVSNEGLEQLWKSAQDYIKRFGQVEPTKPPVIPPSREFSPLFSNHVRLATSGGSAEIAFYTVLLQDIANVATGVLPQDTLVNCAPIALLHSGVHVHRLLVMELLKDFKD